MKKVWLMIAALMLVGGAPKASALLIDDFSDGNTSLVTNTLNDQDRDVDASAVALGGERESTAVYYFSPASSTPGNHNLRVNFLAGGKVQHSQDAGVAGASYFVYDGAGDTNTSLPIDVDGDGLGGVDLSNSTKFVFTIDFADLAVTNVLGVRVYSGDGNFSELNQSLPAIGSTTTVDFLFSNFAVTSGTGADFSNVGAIVFFINGQTEQALDVVIDKFETDEPVIPEPATLTMLGLGLAGLGAIRRRKA